MKNVTLTFSDINIPNYPFKVFFSNTIIDINNLPATSYTFAASVGSSSFELDDDITVGIIALLDTNGDILFFGRQFKLSDSSSPTFENVIPGGCNALLYLNADNCNATTANYQLLGMNTATNFSGTMTVSVFNGQKYLEPNKAGWLQFPQKIISNKSFSIFTKIRAPTVATGSSYSSSDAIIVSDNNSFIQDVILGFGSGGLFSWDETGTVSNSTFLNSSDATIFTKRNNSISIFLYIPAIPSINPHILGGYDGRIFKSTPNTNIPSNANHQLEGLFRTQPATQNGWLGSGGLLRSILVLEGELTDIQMEQIKLAMSME